jgi:hypothetical protein
MQLLLPAKHVNVLVGRMTALVRTFPVSTSLSQQLASLLTHESTVTEGNLCVLFDHSSLLEIQGTYDSC